MANINSLKASNGSGNAALATVQTTRAALASTIIVNTVTNIPTNFHATMGTPHTFTDPVTSETITVISEATAVDFKGHVDGINLEIDTIAPGYVDAGSQVGDIVIIRPTTQWADEMAEVLEVVHNNDGTLKDNIVTTPKLADASVTPNKLATGAQTSVNAADETTTSTSFVAMSPAQSVTVTVGANGLLLVMLSAELLNSTTHESRVTFVLSGANTLAASANNQASFFGTNTVSASRTVLLTGLNAGSTTVTLNKAVTGGTGTFRRKNLTVIPL